MFIAVKKKLVHYTWDIAYTSFNNSIIEKGIGSYRIIKNPYKTKWFADPFILKEGSGEMELLVEEFDSNVNRGRIAKIVIDKITNCIIDCSIILELPTHLSFPVIYRVNNEIIVHPENSASGASYMYRYDKIKNELVDPVCVLNEPVVDAIIRQDEDRYYMYATRLPDPNGSLLKCYVADNLMGTYQFVKDIEFNNNSARMAGHFINYEGKKIRPAQDCDGDYGKAVIFYDNHQEINRVGPKSIKYSGVHTFNTFGDIAVIDLKKYDNPYFVAFKDKIKSIFKQ